MIKIKKIFLPLILILCTLFSGCFLNPITEVLTDEPNETFFKENNGSDSAFSIKDIPEFSGKPYVVINDNKPNFDSADFTTSSFESYSDLDHLGRCGVAYANISIDTMPTEERGSIGQIKPSGWHSVQYDCVDGKSLYNRCHLIGFQLTAENANEKNLITGTRYLNVQGMLPFENMAADYIKETGNHVLYRVTPIFIEDNLVANGVQIEAMSVEDAGEGICFNVYCYNNQPGIIIDYKTGESMEASNIENGEGSTERTYIINVNTRKFHLPSCNSVKEMNGQNKEEYVGTREDLIEQGYEPCGNCRP